MDFSDLVAPTQSPQAQQQKPYWQVLQDYHRAQTQLPEVMSGVDMPSFSRTMGSGYEQGTGADNALRRLSGNIDIGLHHFLGSEPEHPSLTGPVFHAMGAPEQGFDLPQLAGEATKRLAGIVGAPPSVQEGAQRFGQSVPRMATDIGVGSLGGLPGIAATTGISTYGETGRVLPSLLTAGSMFALGKVGDMASQGLLRATGAPTFAEHLAEEAPKALEATKLLPTSETADMLSRYVPSNIGQRIADIAGRQAGMAAVGEATSAAQVLTRPESWDDKWQDLKQMVTPASLTETALQQVPWTVMDAIHGRTAPAERFEKETLPAIKTAFDQRFKTGFKQVYGVEPTLDQVDAGRKAALGEKPTTQPEGAVLASMRQAPTGIDDKTPIKTSEGEWNPLAAVGDVRDRANRIGQNLAQPVELGTAHDVRIASTLRQVEAESGGKLSKDEMASQAAMRVLDQVSSDAKLLGRVSPQFEELERSAGKAEDKANREKEIEGEISKRLTKGPNYDPEFAKRIAVVSGTPDKHWVDAGFPTATVTDPAGAQYDVAQPLAVGAVDKGGAPWMLKQNILQQIQQFRPNDPMSGNETFAARKAALAYDRPLDWSKPEDVAHFFNAIKASVRRAQVDFQRLRSESSVEGEFATKPEATARANVLQEQAQADKVPDQIRVVDMPEGKGFRVVRQKFYSKYSMEQMEADRSLGEQLTPEEHARQEKLELGIPAEAVKGFGKEPEVNNIFDQFEAYDKIADPGTREGRRAGFAQTVVDYLSSMPDSKLERVLLAGQEDPLTATGKRKSIQEISTVKARMIKFVQYLRDGGDMAIKTQRDENGNLQVIPKGDVFAMNEYFGNLGFSTKGNSTPFVDQRKHGMNFFEQFHALSQTLRTELMDPRWSDQRPIGDYGFIPPRFRAEFTKNLYVDPPKQGGWLNYSKNMWKDVDGALEGNTLVTKDRAGNTVRLDGGDNPLRTFLVESTKRQLTTTLGKFTEMFEQFGHDLDPDMLSKLKTVVRLPYFNNIRVGTGISNDFERKGLYHYNNEMLTSSGIWLSPYSDPSKIATPEERVKRAAKLDNPNEILPHLLHEVAHAGTVFGYHNDPAVKAEVDRVFEHLKTVHEGDMELTAEGKFQQSQLYGLTSPEEMLASVHNDAAFQMWLKKQVDPFEPLTEQKGVKTNLFDRVMFVFRRIWSRMVGEDGANTLYARVAELSNRAMEAQEGLRQRLGIEHEGDIYSAVRDKELTPQGNLLRELNPLPWKPSEPTEPKPVGMEPTPQEALSQWREATAYRQSREALLNDFRGNAEQYDDKTVAEHLPRLEAGLNAAKIDEAAKRAALDRVGQGQVLESRVNPLGITDSLKAYSDHVDEDPDKYWFRPIDSTHWMATFGGSLGDKWTFEKRGGLWGYSIPKDALNNVTAGDFANMPQPKVRPWAPSSFETLKAVFTKASYNNEDSEALAGWGMRFASILRNDDTIYGVMSPKLATDRNAAGIAWVPDWAPGRFVGINKDIGAPNYVARIVAHEAAHTWGHTWYSFKEPIFVQVSAAKVNREFISLSPDERKVFVEGLQRLTDEQIEGGDWTGRYYQAAVNDPNEFAAEFVSHTAGMVTQLNKPNAYLQAAFRLLPDNVSTFLQNLTLARAQGLDGVKKAIDATAYSYGINAQDRLLPTVDRLADNFRKYAKSAAETANDQAEFYRMRFMYPDMYQVALNAMEMQVPSITTKEAGSESLIAGHLLESRVTDWMKPVSSALGFRGDDNEPTKPSLWNRIIGNMTNMAYQYPILRPLYDGLMSAQGLEHVRRLQLQTALAGAMKGDRIQDDARTKDLIQFWKNPKLQETFSKIALDLQVIGDNRFDKALKEAGGVLQMVDPSTLNDLEGFHERQYDKYGLSDGEKQILNTVFTGTRNQVKMTNVNLIDSHMSTIRGLATRAIQKATGLPPEQARLASQSLYDSLDALKQGDMQTMQQKSMQFGQMVQDPKIKDVVTQLMQDGMERGTDLEKFLALRMPYFMSERRGGGYAVWWKDDAGKVQREYFQTSTERSKYVQAKDITPMKLIDPSGQSGGSLDDRMTEKLQEVQDKLTERIKSVFGDQEGQKLSGMLDFPTELRNAMNAADVTKLTTPRKQPGTREDLNMFGVHQNYVNSVLSAVKARQVRMEAELHLGDQQFDTEPVLKQMVQQHVDNMLAPDSQLGRTIQAVNFLYYMGGNLSSMLLHTFQQFQAVAPALTARGDSYSGGYSRLKDANVAMVKARTDGKYANPELEAAVSRAKVEKVIDSGPLSEFDHSADLSMVNRLRASQGLGESTIFDLLKNRLYAASNLARRFYSVLPTWNSEAAFVAGFTQAREQGKSPDEAYNEARFLKNQTIFGGGKGDRPIGLFSINDQYGVGRTAAQAMWSLQTFEVGMLNLFGQFTRQSLNPKGLTPAQAKQVRKATAQMYVTQLAIAGTLGLPFVGAVLTSINKLFPDTNPELATRDFLNNLAGDNKGTGNVWGSALATGLPSAFDQAPDMGSRLALHGVLGASAYSGLAPDNILGPTGSLIGNLLKGVQAGARGEPAQTVQAFMPRGFQRMFTSLEEGSSFVSPTSGKQLATDLTPAERLERFIGYTPARVARLRDAEHLAKLSEAAEQADKEKFVSKQALMMEQPGAENTVRQNIMQRSQEKKTANPRQLSMEVAKRYEETHMPTDPRNVGGKSTLQDANALRGVLGSQSPSPAYMDRIGLQQSIAARLGMGMPSGGAVKHAATLDAVMQMYPWLTTPEARAATSRGEQSSLASQFPLW